MRARGPSSQIGTLRIAALAACAMGMLAPGIGELNHALHAPASATIHDEAAHPNAAPHLDQEEHLRLDQCLLCLHGGEAPLEPSRSSSQLEDSDSAGLVVTLIAAARGPRTSASPRAPPV